jgi:tetraacyldisaccharide 4'-kinase
VPPEEPRWWYGAGTSVAASVLQPVGWLVGRIATRRWRTARPYRAGLSVVCIGNFTAGGTGKTPFAIEVARLLRAMGETPVFLSRGYGGADLGPRAVNAAGDRAGEVGDEALLLAAAAPTFVSRDRAAGAKAIETAIAAGRLTATVIVMDDGLQNPALTKDLTIAVVDGRRGFGNSLVIPAGPLRAPLAFQMTLADAIVVNGATEAGTVVQCLRSAYSRPILAVSVAPAQDSAWLAAKPIVAFAGIGNPARFFDLLQSLGGTLVETVTFADHQPLNDADANQILNIARQHGAAIVTTEKDLARLTGLRGACGRLHSAARALPIRLHFAGSDEARLRELLQAAVGPAAARR